jgi:hypothetical protein
MSGPSCSFRGTEPFLGESDETEIVDGKHDFTPYSVDHRLNMARTPPPKGPPQALNPFP